MTAITMCTWVRRRMQNDYTAVMAIRKVTVPYLSKSAAVPKMYAGHRRQKSEYVNDDKVMH